MLEPLNMLYYVAKETFQIELKLRTLKQGDYPGGLNIITQALKSGGELVKERGRKKSQERFKV